MTVTRFPLIFAINLYVGAFKAMVNQANSIAFNISNTATVRLTEQSKLMTRQIEKPKNRETMKMMVNL